MPFPKGPLWTQLQLKVAYEILVNKKSPKQIVDESSFPKAIVYKVANWLAEGYKPPTLDPEKIKDSPLGKSFGAAKNKTTPVKQQPINESIQPEDTPSDEKTGEGSAEEPPEKPPQEPPVAAGPPEPDKGKKKGDGKVPATTDAVTQTSWIKLIPQVQQLPMTPPIYVGYMVALKRGYRGELVDFISLAIEDFWAGRKVNMYQEMSAITLGEEAEPDGVEV